MYRSNIFLTWPVRLLLILAAITGLLWLGVVPANAVVATDNSSSSLYDYCVKEAQQAKNACDDENFANSGNDLINATINVASYHCTGLPDDEESACITKKAKEYIKKAAEDDHSSAAKFKTALHQVLDDAGGSMKHPSSQSSLGGDSAPTPSGEDPAIKCSQNNCDFVGKYVNPAINLLSIAFGLIAVISIIMGGIQYTVSGGDPQKVTSAKQRIAKTIVAVLAYFVLYAFLQFLVPGGLFN
jgi:hypothetical protein